MLEGNWWPSEDQLNQMEIPPNAQFQVPKPTDWKSLDRARSEAWMQCKREIELHRSNINKIPAVSAAIQNGGQSVKSAVFNCLLGPNSEHGRVIKRATNIDNPTYCCFLYTFLLSCQTNQSVPSLHTNDDIRKEHLMPREEHNRLWGKISKAGEARAAGANCEDPLWLQLQRVFNEQARELFMWASDQHPCRSRRGPSLLNVHRASGDGCSSWWPR